MPKKSEGEPRDARVVALFRKSEKKEYIAMCEAFDPPQDFSKHIYDKCMSELESFRASKAF